MPASFRGTSFLVTYPQSLFDFDDLYTHFTSIAPVQYCRIGLETHEDGNPHLHAVVHFESKQQLGARRFDFRDRHPNVQTVGRTRQDWDRVVTYCGKEGNFRDWGVPRHHEKRTWSQVIHAESRSEAQDVIREQWPRDWIINRRNIDYALDQMYPMQPSPFVGRSLESFLLPDEFSEWSLGNFA